MTGPDHTQETNSDRLLESLSHAVSLTVLELDANPQKLVPAFFLANLMSPALWDWRNEKRAVNEHGVVYSPRNRLNQIQRFFHRYTFTNLPARDYMVALVETKSGAATSKLVTVDLRNAAPEVTLDCKSINRNAKVVR